MTIMKLGLLGVAITTAVTSVALPVMAQRVCIESESNGRIVCGRVVNDSRFDNGRYSNRNDDRNDDRDSSRYNTRDSNTDGFDERFYLIAYPDVKAAIARGQLKDAYTHYRKAGRFEGRFPRFSEASYLAKNPDVAEAVRRRSIRSGYDHWLKVGRFENRKL